jgi:hypothetical protein
MDHADRHRGSMGGGKQAPPNDGALTKADTIAFDIVTMDGASEGWLMAGDTLYNVDLATGKGSMVVKIPERRLPSPIARLCRR